METTKNKKVIAAGLLVMSLTMACNSALAPILAEVGKFFPDASDSAIQIVLTLINLTTLPMMLIEPAFESKITKKRYRSYRYCFNADRWFNATGSEFTVMDAVCCKYCDLSWPFAGSCS